jgi:osmoprotectant transport system substrate-binding protein
VRRRLLFRLALALAGALLPALALSACGTDQHQASAATRTTGTTTTTTTKSLPGAGKPQVTIGDKNFTEQFILGELYDEALSAQGFDVVLNRNIGPTEVTLSALQSGGLDMYPEYLNVWDDTIAGEKGKLDSSYAAYQAGQSYAVAHGLVLLSPTPFSDTSAIGVTFNYAAENGLRTIADLQKVAPGLTFGGPPQFQTDPDGLSAVEQSYGVVPSAFKPLNIGDQYQALDQGSVQAAAVATTDGQLLSGDYTLLSDPEKVFGWGNVVPVVSARVLDAEGPVFAQTINKVSSLLTLPVIRQLNAAVDISHQDPAYVARQFLMAHGLVPPTGS